MPPRQNSIRFQVQPRDVPPEKAARRLHLTVVQFEDRLPELLSRGFPRPDVTTGMFDLVEIDRWMDSRSGLTPALTQSPQPQNFADMYKERAARLANGHR